ncbi:MAG: thioether cross-link-forming SCIFF peptide maturase [Eubacteriales bacterium]|nr:thioether cross-link-forming SCIFF peptide maturase [Eubacteriales bacterium]
MIHHYSMQGTNIVLDVNSNSVHVFDDTAYEVLKHYIKAREAGNDNSGINTYKNEIVNKLKLKYNKTNVEAAIEEISGLENDGLLFSPEEDIELALSMINSGEIKSMCINISHDCNMRCTYCFASTGNFGLKRSLMDKETGFKAIDFLISRSGTRKNLEVDFFGGEPLMNFENVLAIIQYAKSREKMYNKHFRFTITTNALILDDEQMKAIDELFDNVVLSLDGSEETNDRMRLLPDGTGSYKEIMPRIKAMTEIRGDRDHYVRGTFTAYNLNFSKDVIHLADEGFKSISLEPVVAPENKKYSIKEEHLNTIYDEYEKLAQEYLKRKKEGRGFNYFHFNISLDQGPCLVKRVKGCGAGCEYVAVTPEGDIYPCHQFVGKEEYKLGNLNNGVLNDKIRDKFRNTNIATKEQCISCWAKYHCSGGCSANALEANGDIMKPYSIGCELEKKRLECAIWLKTQE